MTSRDDISRRDLFRGRFLTGLAGSVRDAMAIDEDVDAAAPSTRSGRSDRPFPVHRPPGAIDETSFLDGCTRCDECLTVCPHDAIVHAPARMRGAAGTPMIDASRQPCLMCEDTPCITACEPGVLSPQASLKMGRAVIVDQTCLAHQGTFCTVCSEQCPVEGAIRLDAGKPSIVEAMCTGCGVCHFVCPAPSNAVIVMPAAERVGRVEEEEENGSGSGEDEVVFPPMSDAILDGDQLRHLFEDLEDHAVDVEVRLKGGARTYADRSATLTDAGAAVAEGTAGAVQIRYTYEAARWMDTLMIRDDGVRLIRVRHDQENR